MMKRFLISLTVLGLLLQTAAAFADNFASFEKLAQQRFKKLKNKTQEEFLLQFGKPEKTASSQQDEKTLETLTYRETNCRYRFTFVDRVFSKGERTCF